MRKLQRAWFPPPIKDAEARRLPYLQAVIKEGLHIMPPATGANFKLVPPEGDVLNGHLILSGTQIGSSYLSIQHSASIFGPDAAVFRPERWLDTKTDATRLANMTSIVDLVFRYGRYQYLGKNVALMEFNKLFVELLRRFDFAIVKPETVARVTNAGIWIVEDFCMRVKKRREE